MIEVGDAAVIERKIVEIAVVGVLLDENYFAGLTDSRIRFATVVLPEPVPPEMPIIMLISDF